MTTTNSRTTLTRLAKALEDGATADIFYDAAGYGDTAKVDLIEATQHAMHEAARVLRCLPLRALPERATREEIETARRLYANDDIAIDADAPSSRVDRGVWVQAWVFLEEGPR